MTPFSGQPRGIAVFGMPRSGTTFIVRAFTDIVGCPLVNIAPLPPSCTGNTFSNGWREHTIDQSQLQAALAAGGPPFVTHLHPPASAWTIDMVNRHRLAVVFNRRRLPDCLVSLWAVIRLLHTRHGQAVAAAGNLLLAPLRFPIGALTRFAAMPDGEQLALVAELAAPWYVQYVAAWEAARPAFDYFLTVDHETLRQDDAAVVGSLLAVLGASPMPGRVAAWVAGNSHHNRTRDAAQPAPALSPDLVRHLHGLASRYNGAAFADRLVGPLPEH